MDSLPLFYGMNCITRKEGKFRKLVKECFERAHYAVKRFNDRGIKAWRNKNSIIVISQDPLKRWLIKWQLAVEGEIAHLITLPHVPKKTIDRFVDQSPPI